LSPNIATQGYRARTSEKVKPSPERVAFGGILQVYAGMVNHCFCRKIRTYGQTSAKTDEECFRRACYPDYQVSTKGRFFSVRGLGAGSERNPVMTQERVSAGSMTSSISNNVAVLSALPRS